MGRINTLMLALLFITSSVGSLRAQENMNLSLKETIDLGLENSKQLKIVLSKRAEAQHATKEMKWNMLPDIGASGQYLMINEPTISVGEALSGGSSEESSQGLGVAPKYLAIGSVSAQMPVFAGFKIKNGIQSSKFLEEAANLDVESQKSEVILNLVNAYVNLYKAQEAVKLVQDDLQEAQRRVADFTQLKDNGVLALNDLLKAQLQESNTSLALLDAENNLKVANYNMDLLLGLDESTKLLLSNVNIELLNEMYDLSQMNATALSERKDLQAIEKREKASETAIKIAKADYWPTIGLSGGYAALDIDEVASITNALNLGVGLSFSISKLYKNGSHVDQAQEQFEQTKYMHGQMVDKVKSEVYHSLNDYMLSIQRIQVYENAEKLANENYRITKDKHDNSLATTTDLLDADIEKFQAELNLRFSEVDAMYTYCKLLQVTGQLDEHSIENLSIN